MVSALPVNVLDMADRPPNYSGTSSVSHHITIVDDHELPADHDFVFVRHRTGAHIFYRRSTLDERVLEDSWAAYRAVMGGRGPTVPTRATERAGQVLDFVRRAV